MKANEMQLTYQVHATTFDLFHAFLHDQRYAESLVLSRHDHFQVAAQQFVREMLSCKTDAQFAVDQLQVQGTLAVHLQRQTVAGVLFQIQIAQIDHALVAELVLVLRIPAVEQERNLLHLEQIQLKAFVPVEAGLARTNHRSRLVLAIALDHAVQITIVRRRQGVRRLRAQASTGQQMNVQQAAVGFVRVEIVQLIHVLARADHLLVLVLEEFARIQREQVHALVLARLHRRRVRYCSLQCGTVHGAHCRWVV